MSQGGAASRTKLELLGEGNGRGAGFQTQKDVGRRISIRGGDEWLGFVQRRERGRPGRLRDPAGCTHPGADPVAVRRRGVMSGMLQIMGDGSAHCAAHHQQYGKKEQTGRGLNESSLHDDRAESDSTDAS